MDFFGGPAVVRAACRACQCSTGGLFACRGERTRRAAASPWLRESRRPFAESVPAWGRAAVAAKNCGDVSAGRWPSRVILVSRRCDAYKRQPDSSDKFAYPLRAVTILRAEVAPAPLPHHCQRTFSRPIYFHRLALAI